MRMLALNDDYLENRSEIKSLCNDFDSGEEDKASEALQKLKDFQVNWIQKNFEAQETYVQPKLHTSLYASSKDRSVHQRNS